MFETDPILWLQSGASEPLTAVVRAVSALGYRVVCQGLALAVLLGIDFRRGVVLWQIVSWNEALTGWLKAWWALPRPADVDSTVQLLDFDGGRPGPFRERDAGGFWEPLPGDVVAHYRGLPRHNWGLPSGHVSAMTALGGTIAVLWRRWWLGVAAMVVVVAMGLARMYLGRHFLADVLAGAVVGSLGVGAAWLSRRGEKPAPAPQSSGLQHWSWLVGVPLVGILAGLGLSGELNRALVQLCGFNLGLCALRRWPIAGQASARQRLARVGLGLGLWVCFVVVSGPALHQLWPGVPAAATLIFQGLASGGVLWSTVRLAERWGWYGTAG